MKTYRLGVVAGLVALLCGASPAPLSYAAGPAPSVWGGPASAPPSMPVGWGSAGGSRLVDAIRGGLIHLATVFTDAGAQIITNRIIQAGTAPKNIGWGTGSTDDALNRTALVTEAAPTTSGGRTVGTESRTTVTKTNDNYQVVGSVTAGGTLAITEAATFDAVSAGNMHIRSTFSAVNVLSGDSIAFTFGLKLVPA